LEKWPSLAMFGSYRYFRAEVASYVGLEGQSGNNSKREKKTI